MRDVALCAFPKASSRAVVFAKPAHASKRPRRTELGESFTKVPAVELALCHPGPLEAHQLLDMKVMCSFTWP